MKALKKVWDNFEEVICAVLMLVMLLITFNNVISRYVLHASLSFTDEVTTGLFVYLTTFGTAVAAKRKAHLGLSLLTDSLSPKKRGLAMAFTFVLCTVFSIVLTYTGFIMTMNQMKSGQFSAALEIPEWIYGLALPLGGVFMSIRFAQAAWSELHPKKEEEVQ